MTLEQVIEIIERYKLRIPPTVYYELLADVREVEEEQEPTTKNDLGVDCISREQALVAIRNLYPSMPRVDFNGSLRKWVDKYKPYIECDDAIKQLPSVTPQEPQSFKWCTDCREYDQEKHCCHRWSKVIRNTVEEMKQEQKIGHWIEVTNGRGGHECDVCHDYAPSFQNGNEYLSAFCPNCGAKMVEPQESEET